MGGPSRLKSRPHPEERPRAASRRARARRTDVRALAFVAFGGALLLGACDTARQTGCNTVEAACRMSCRDGATTRGADRTGCEAACAAQNPCRAK